VNEDLKSIDGLCEKIIEQRDRIEELEAELERSRSLLTLVLHTEANRAALDLKTVNAAQAARIEALEAAREIDLRECAAQLDQNTATMDVARARIEALEAALERIEALCSETDIINVLSAIARTALDKDAGR
jgi:predicted RNase H-like nuclease (RuvC/YqgF family)